MKKIGLFYSFNTHRTSKVARLIADQFPAEQVDHINIEEVVPEQFLAYENILMGSATWFEGELPNHWDEFVPALEELALHGKKVALFGLGNQEAYPHHFGDAIGTLAKIVSNCGATVVGEWPAEGYKFATSGALRGDKFIGLMVDDESQPELTDARVKEWSAQIKKMFK